MSCCGETHIEQMGQCKEEQEPLSKSLEEKSQEQRFENYNKNEGIDNIHNLNDIPEYIPDNVSKDDILKIEESKKIGNDISSSYNDNDNSSYIDCIDKDNENINIKNKPQEDTTNIKQNYKESKRVKDTSNTELADKKTQLLSFIHRTRVLDKKISTYSVIPNSILDRSKYIDYFVDKYYYRREVNVNQNTDTNPNNKDGSNSNLEHFLDKNLLEEEFCKKFARDIKLDINRNNYTFEGVIEKIKEEITNIQREFNELKVFYEKNSLLKGPNAIKLDNKLIADFFNNLDKYNSIKKHIIIINSDIFIKEIRENIDLMVEIINNECNNYNNEIHEYNSDIYKETIQSEKYGSTVDISTNNNNRDTTIYNKDNMDYSISDDDNLWKYSSDDNYQSNDSEVSFGNDVVLFENGSEGPMQNHHSIDDTGDNKNSSQVVNREDTHSNTTLNIFLRKPRTPSDICENPRNDSRFLRVPE